jgi:hypothetical protein
VLQNPASPRNARPKAVDGNPYNNTVDQVPAIFSPAIGDLLLGTDGKKSGGYFKGAEAIDFIRYLLRKYKMTCTGNVKSEDDLFMFENTNVNEINLLQTHMDRVRVMLKVRKETCSLEVLENLEKFIENSFMKSKDLCEEIRKIRQDNENLSKITLNFVRGIQDRT